MLVDAYVARIEGMRRTGLYSEAHALADLVRSRYPAASARVDRVTGRKTARPENLEALLAPLADPDLPKERRAAVEATIIREVADPRLISGCTALPLDHPLRQAAAAVAKALTAVTSGPVSDDAITLVEVSRRSPLAPWKALIRAIACFYQNDDDACEKWLAMIDADSAPARAAPAMRTMMAAASKTKLKPKAAALAAKVGGDLAAMRTAVEAFDGIWASGKERRPNSAIRSVLKACSAVPAGIADRVRQHLYVRCALAKKSPVALVEIAQTSFPEDAYFWRLCARGHEVTRRIFRAGAYWEMFRRAAVKEGWFAERSPQAAALYLHMAGVLAPLPAEHLTEAQDLFVVDNGHDPSFGKDPMLRTLAELCDYKAPNPYFLYPEQLFARAVQIDPHASTFQQWLSWAQEHTKGWKQTDDVAQRWHEQCPDDVRPLLHLMESTEKRNALKKALGHLEAAERIDRLNPDVRRARLRLLMATTVRHLKQKKPHLAEKDFAAIDALPEAQEGDRPVLVDALRWACAVH